MADYLELLPAVDIADGPGRPARPGRRRLREAVRRPGRGGAALAGGRRRVDPPRRPRRGVRPRPQPRAAGRDRRRARHPGRDERRHPRRRVAGGRDGHRLPPGQHRHRRARAARSGAPRRSRRTATGSPSASTSAAAPSPRAAGPARAATSTTCWPGSTREGCARYVVTDVNKDGMLQGPNLQLLQRRLRRHRPAGRGQRRHHRARRPRALMGLVGDGVEGAIVGTALYEGRFTLDGRAGADPGPHDASRPRDPVPRRRRRPGGQGHELPRSCATPATRSSWPHLYDAEGADELTFLDISASHEGRATTMEVVCRTAEQVFIPLTVGGGCPASTTSTGCSAPAPTRSRSTPPPSTAPSWSPRSPTGSATRCWCSRSTRAGPPGTDSGFEVTTHGGRKSAGLDAIAWAARARRARRRRDPAQRDGRRRHPGRLRPRPDPRRPPRGHRSR